MKSSRRFSSTLGPVIVSYLALKRALGRRFSAEEDVLASFDRFLARHAFDRTVLDAEIFAAWCLTLGHLTATVRRNRMRIVRNLCLYMRRSNTHCFVPDTAGFPARSPAQRPYIFTEAQVLSVLRAAECRRTTSTSPLCAAATRLAVVLLYTAGLRRGELVRLVISNYDPVEHTLLVRSSKFHKSRLVALSNDAAQDIDRYLQARRRLPCDAQAPLLVRRWRGLHAYSGCALGQSLHRLFRQAGVFTNSGAVPRVHDLRHTYACHVLLRWYRAGFDVQAKLPALATAMGHVSIASTAYYLAFLTPLVQAANERFARHCQTLLPDFIGQGGGQ
jgi:integrase/recombinase XerD